jgi:hypothetical protein
MAAGSVAHKHRNKLQLPIVKDFPKWYTKEFKKKLIRSTELHYT